MPIDVSKLAQTYATQTAAKAALEQKKITQDEFDALFNYNLQSQNGNFFKIEKAETRQKTPEEQAAHDNAELDRQIQTAGMKILPGKAESLEKTLKAMDIEQKKDVLELLKQIGEEQKAGKPTEQLEAQLDEKMRPFILKGNGVQADGVDVTGVSSVDTTGQKHQSFTVDIDVRDEADIDKEMDKPETRQRLSRYYDEKEHKMYEAASASKEDLAAHAQVLKEKEDALEAALKAAKAERKELEKKKGAITPKESARLNELLKMDQELKQIKQARQAAEGKRGVRKAKGAHNDNVEAETRVSKRQVYMDKEAAKAAIENGADKDDVRVATEDDMATLEALVLTAANSYEKASAPQDKAIWRELVELQYEIGEDGKIVKDADGNFKQKRPIAEAPTKDIKDALADLAGADFSANYSEREIIANETGRSKQDVRHMFLTYGFDAPAAFGKRVVNGLAAGAPALAAGLIGLLQKNKAEAHAKAVAEAEAHDTQRLQGELSVTAHAEVWTEDQVISQKDEFGRTQDKRIAGLHAEDTQTQTLVYDLVAKADAYSKTVVETFSEAISRVPVAGALLPAAISFLAGFAKNPRECGATKAATEDKLARFTEMYKGGAAKKLGNQVIQLQKQISDLCGDERFGVALTAAVLQHASGSQNEVMTRREIEGAISVLERVVTEMKKPKTTVEVPPQGQVEEHEEPSPTVTEPCFTDVKGEVKEPTTYTVEHYDTVDTIIKAKYPDAVFKTAKAEFLAANPDLKDPNSIKVGQKFVLPTLADGTAPANNEVTKVRGGRRIDFKPSQIRDPQGIPTWAVQNCNTGEIVATGFTSQQAAADAATDHAERARQKK